MPKNYEEPVRVQSDSNHIDTEETHPAYAQIRASRVSGQAVLYGSDFKHQHYMTISILRSKLNRSLSHDWNYAHDEIIEVAMSESQWATFVSTPNSGAGVPCTLQHLHGKLVPQIPDPPERAEQFRGEIKDTIIEARNALKAVRVQLSEMKATDKAKRPVSEELAKIERAIEGSFTFIADMFGEHMENVVERAKIEINAYATDVISRAGIAALARATGQLGEGDVLEPPIKLIGPRKDDYE